MSTANKQQADNAADTAPALRRKSIEQTFMRWLLKVRYRGMVTIVWD
jgi:hypothetical protein